MITLSFTYSKEFEVKRIQNTIKRLDWYFENGYSIDSLSFPENIDIKVLRAIPEGELLKIIETEYDEAKFISDVASIQQMYNEYETRLEGFIKSLDLPVLSDIKVFLTRYGIGGSYSLPNEVIINISKFFSVGLVRALLHEILHLHIQHMINQYKIGQWEKEAIVNLMFEKAFPEIYKKNNSPIDTTTINKIFEENFPNIEKIISLVSIKS